MSSSSLIGRLSVFICTMTSDFLKNHLAQAELPEVALAGRHELMPMLFSAAAPSYVLTEVFCILD